MAHSRAQKILETLRRTFTTPKLVPSEKDMFKTLIRTIISQNTADRNTARAFENLSKQFEITPEALVGAETGQIERCLKTAGLYRNKARTIKHVSKIIIDKFNGDLDRVLSLSFEEARGVLMELPGVGPKTADVVLLFAARKPTIPVDTHVDRVSKRLGLAPLDGGYEAVRGSLQHTYDPKDYLAVHVLLIAHGRKYCRARAPLCKKCPINMLCPSRDVCDRSA
jgi:endonuclease-3